LAQAILPSQPFSVITHKNYIRILRKSSIKMNLNEMGEGVDWLHLAQNRVQ
jgi:hypothetical protein